MKPEKTIPEKTANKRFAISSAGTKTINTDDLDESKKAVEALKEAKVKSFDVSDENDKSITHFTKGTFDKNYHAKVSWSK